MSKEFKNDKKLHKNGLKLDYVFLIDFIYNCL